MLRTLTIRRLSSTLASALAFSLAAGCTSSEPTRPRDDVAHLSHQRSDAASASLLAEIRRATARYHDLEAAIADGYGARVTGCMSSGEGGMGVHYANLSLFDATVDVSRPELLVYAPGPNGRLRLVAVEYAVPLSAWTGAEPPSLHGQTFHVQSTFGLWVLHAWIWQPNPNGAYADWNPRVSCNP